MKILVFANYGMGLYKFRKELLIELVSQKNEVFVSLPDDEYRNKLEDLGCQFIDTPVSRRGTNPITDLRLLIKYNNIIKQIKPDIVLSYTIKPNVYGGLACRLNNTPFIANITGLGTAVENGGILQKISLFLYRISLRQAKCVFFQNKENLSFLSKKIRLGKHRLIPGSGVNLNDYSLLDYPPDGVIHFLFIARVMKEKGIDQYLDAAEYIKKHYPNIIFHIVGFCEDAYEDRLNALQDKGIIQYHGLQNDVTAFYKISHCVVHPTYYPEGMSNVLLESAACGRPIITTNRSGCREIVNNGENGYLVEERNSQELIEKIEKFMQLKQETKIKMGLAGRKKVEREFNRKLVVENYLDEINQAVLK